MQEIEFLELSKKATSFEVAFLLNIHNKFFMELALFSIHVIEKGSVIPFYSYSNF